MSDEPDTFLDHDADGLHKGDPQQRLMCRICNPANPVSTQHVATVRTLRTPRPSRKTTYLVNCTRCGQLGFEQHYPADAALIAALHNEAQRVGGGVR